jgi:hypothetical protein
MSHSGGVRARAVARAVCVLSALSLLAAGGCSRQASPAAVQRTPGSATAWWAAARPATGSGWRIRTIAGGVGGPAPARTVSIDQPCGVTWSGGTLLAGTADGVVRAVDTRTGLLTTPAGVGYTDYGVEGFPRPTADGSPAGSAHFYLSCDAVIDPHGNLVLSDSSFLTGNETQTDRMGDNRVRVVAMSSGTFYGQPMTKGHIYTIAGNGSLGYSGDGGPARSAELGKRAGLAIDPAGTILVASVDGTAGFGPGGHIRVIAAVSGRFYGQQMTAGDIYTIAGGGSACAAGTGGHPAAAVALGLRTLFYQKYAPAGAPSGLRIDHSGNIVIAATDCGLVQVLAASDGSFYGRKMTAGDIYTIAGGGSADAGDGHPATSAKLSQPVGVAVDHSGDVVIAESNRNRVRLVAASSGQFFGQQMVRGDIYTLAGGHGAGWRGDGGPARLARLNLPAALAVDGHGNVAIADYGNHRVRLIAVTSGSFYGQSMTGGDIYTVAGNRLISFSGRGPALHAQFGVPADNFALPVAVDHAGDMLVADQANRRVRLVAARSGALFGRPVQAGHIYTLAYCAKTACQPGSVAFDRAGNAVVATHSRIEVIATRSGTYYGQVMKAGSTYVIAGGGTATPNGVPATRARLWLTPPGVAVDGQGNVIISDTVPIGDQPPYVRVIATSSGTFYGKAMRADYIYALARGGSVYAVDHHSNVLFDGGYKVNVIAGQDGTFYGQPMSAGNVYTVAGTWTYGYSGDGGPATAADIANGDVAVDAGGNLLITDGYGPPRIRVVAAATGTFYGHKMTRGDIYTIAGGGTSLANGVPPLSAMLGFGDSLAAAPNGSIVVSDTGGQRVRLISR